MISRSPGELEPVFEAMLANATRLCGTKFGTLTLCEGDVFHNVALYNLPPAYTARLRVPLRPRPMAGPAHVARTEQKLQGSLQQQTATGGCTGYGLAIAKQIVEMHGGRIEVESILGKGSTFQMEIPFAPNPEARLMRARTFPCATSRTAERSGTCMRQ